MTTSLKNSNANARKKMWMPSLAMTDARSPASRSVEQHPETQRKVLSHEQTS